MLRWEDEKFYPKKKLGKQLLGLKMYQGRRTYQSTLLRFAVFPLFVLVGRVEDPEPASGG